MHSREHHLILHWLVLAGLALFAVYATYTAGYIQLMVSTDSSKISLVIIAIFLVGLAHSCRETWRLSLELNALDAVQERLRGLAPLDFKVVGPSIVLPDGSALPACFTSQMLLDALRQLKGAGGSGESAVDLLNARAARIRDQHDIGWFLVDLMMKLGFLGTVIGFIAMLGSVADTAEIDVSIMQRVLKQMSYGMGTALYTTLAGLIGAILLGTIYYVLDQALNGLVVDTVEIAESRLSPTGGELAAVSV